MKSAATISKILPHSPVSFSGVEVHHTKSRILEKQNTENRLKSIQPQQVFKQGAETVQNLWDTAKAVLTGKFLPMKAYLRNIETFQINNLTLFIQEQEEQQQTNPRASRRREITKIRAELNDIEIKRRNQRITIKELVL